MNNLWHELAEIIHHVDDLQRRMKRLAGRIERVETALAQQRNLLPSWSPPLDFDHRPHFGHLA
jgi:hypothetical protein